MGFAHLPELESWYLSNQDAHLAKKSDDFLKDLYKRALPVDFVWETKGRIRELKQGSKDYGLWSQELRADHLLLTEKILSTRDFVKSLLYGMDPELAAILRRGTSLKGSGFHEDDQAELFISASSSAGASSGTKTTTSAIDYEKFDREARDEWARIAQRKEANAAQIREATKKQAKLTSSSTITPLATKTTTSTASQTSTNLALVSPSSPLTRRIG